MRKAQFDILAILCTGLFVSCTNKEKTQEKTDKSGEKTIVKDTVALAPLESGEVYYKDKNPFDKTLELTGNHITGDTAIFKPNETEMCINGNYLIMKNMGNPPFRIFKLPEAVQIKTVGKSGNGPDEFLYSTIIPTSDDSLLCYTFEKTNRKLYKLRRDGTLEYSNHPFNVTDRKEMFSDMQVVNAGIDDLFYVTESKTGKSIYRITQQADSAVEKEVFPLALNPKRKSPFTYIGSFALNAKKKRMAYAYKYFKIIKFMDLEAKTVKTINFEQKGFDDNSLNMMDGLDNNATHYWGACAQDNYVYFLYSGRTPNEVGKEMSKKNYYIYVEQYDWNGKPVHKYKLDKWGYFTVDEKNKKLYLVSPNYDEPFFVYQLP